MTLKPDEDTSISTVQGSAKESHKTPAPIDGDESHEAIESSSHSGSPAGPGKGVAGPRQHTSSSDLTASSATASTMISTMASTIADGSRGIRVLHHDGSAPSDGSSSEHVPTLSPATPLETSGDSLRKDSVDRRRDGVSPSVQRTVRAPTASVSERNVGTQKATSNSHLGLSDSVFRGALDAHVRVSDKNGDTSTANPPNIHGTVTTPIENSVSDRSASAEEATSVSHSGQAYSKPQNPIPDSNEVVYGQNKHITTSSGSSYRPVKPTDSISTVLLTPPDSLFDAIALADEGDGTSSSTTRAFSGLEGFDSSTKLASHRDSSVFDGSAVPNDAKLVGDHETYLAGDGKISNSAGASRKTPGKAFLDQSTLPRKDPSASVSLLVENPPDSLFDAIALTDTISKTLREHSSTAPPDCVPPKGSDEPAPLESEAAPHAEAPTDVESSSVADINTSSSLVARPHETSSPLQSRSPPVTDKSAQLSGLAAPPDSLASAIALLDSSSSVSDSRINGESHDTFFVSCL